MNKQQIREAISAAIQFSDETDATAEPAIESLGSDYRLFRRLNALVISLEIALGAHAAGVQEELQAFRMRVIDGSNPLRDAAPDVQEKSK